ncbi:MAG: tRNA uridine-5-carboxymethylaminomethyl(34) synthesis GTPase MnmE, partial [Succinivibrio sp.]
QGHAGSVAPQRVLNAILSLDGIRQAGPGEFTRRAFENGRIDLTEAEAVEDLISSGSEAAARAALASLTGAFARDADAITAAITSFRVRIEGCLDFPEEHEDFFDSGKAASELDAIIKNASESLARASQGAKLSEGARIAIAGAPNAGKSSLLNALSGQDRAIVTSIPGTTRDVLSEEIEIDGVVVTFTDTAGIRQDPGDVIEEIGIRKAIDTVRQSDLTVLLLDGSAKPDGAGDLLSRIMEINPDPRRILLVMSKSDLRQDRDAVEFAASCKSKGIATSEASVKSDGGLDGLKKTLKQMLGIVPMDGAYSARKRHVAALSQAIASMRRARAMLDDGNLVLCAEELRQSQDQIGEITGKVTSDDLLGKIFSTFCIGK